MIKPIRNRMLRLHLIRTGNHSTREEENRHEEEENSFHGKKRKILLRKVKF